MNLNLTVEEDLQGKTFLPTWRAPLDSKSAHKGRNPKMKNPKDVD
jgi:hypothetical protein